MGVIVPGDFKVVHIKRYFALNVFVLTRFHCSQFSLCLSLSREAEVSTTKGQKFGKRRWRRERERERGKKEKTSCHQEAKEASLAGGQEENRQNR